MTNRPRTGGRLSSLIPGRPGYLGAAAAQSTSHTPHTEKFTLLLGTIYETQNKTANSRQISTICSQRLAQTFSGPPHPSPTRRFVDYFVVAIHLYRNDKWMASVCATIYQTFCNARASVYYN